MIIHLLLKVEVHRAVNVIFLDQIRNKLREAHTRMYHEEKRRCITPEKQKLFHADVYNTLFQCHPGAIVFSVLPGYDLPA